MRKSVLALIAFILLLNHSSFAQGITVFRDANWSGPSMMISGDWDYMSNPDWNDQISSIRIPQGRRIQVFVDGQFQGASQILTGDWTVTGPEFNDIISSIRFLHHERPMNEVAVAPAITNKLCCGQELPLGGELHALNGIYMLAFQQDRNLVVYKTVPENRPLWATATNNRVNRCVMQGDGNLVLYNDRNPVWSSNTYGNQNAYLVMQDDGNLVIYSTDGRALWASNTMQAVEPVVYQAPAPEPVVHHGQGREHEREQVVHHERGREVAAPVTPVADTGPCAMSQQSYDAAVHAIDGQAFRDTKAQMAKQAIKNKCLSLDQIRGIAKLFAFEDQTLDFLKYAYDFTDNKNDYYTLSDIFAFDSNVRDFNSFLGTK